jgi:hypothetical protein
MDLPQWPDVGVLEMGKSPVGTTKPELTAFKIAQYTALRDEILKRLEMQHQLIALALIALGTLVTLSVKGEIPALVLWLTLS